MLEKLKSCEKVIARLVEADELPRVEDYQEAREVLADIRTVTNTQPLEGEAENGNA